MKSVESYPLVSAKSHFVKLQKYFEELKPFGKRVSEQKAFQELKTDYSERDIADCVEYLQEHGLRDGQSCHSPMAFLSHVSCPGSFDRVELKI